MKRFKTSQNYFALIMLILGILFIAGCSSSDEAALLTDHYVLPGACTGASPKVNSSDPANGANPVALDATITATFSEEMQAGTIISANPGDQLTFTLWDSEHVMIEGTVTYTYNLVENYAEFTPTAALEAGTEYTARITKHAESAGGTSLSCNYEWKFTTESNT